MKDSALSTHSLLFCLRAPNIEKIQQNVMNRSDFGGPLRRKKKTLAVEEKTGGDWREDKRK